MYMLSIHNPILLRGMGIGGLMYDALIRKELGTQKAGPKFQGIVTPDRLYSCLELGLSHGYKSLEDGKGIALGPM